MSFEALQQKVTHSSPELTKVLAAWRDAIGDENVVTESHALNEISRATYEIPHGVVAILRPRDRQALQAAVRIAHQHRTPVYPVSGGRNWGLGSCVPAAGGCAVLDLGGMTRILDLNREMATVTVEPGVTFEALQQYLAREAPELMMDSIGSTGRASIVGNAVERGHGMGSYADRFAHVCGLEVVLADGDVIRTGYGAYDDSPLAGLARWGTGPSLDGLFSQSGLGVVASLTFWLQVVPKHFQSFVFGLDTDQGLAQMIDRWRRERLQGTRASLRIFNDLRLTAISQPYPFATTGGAVPLPETLRRELRSFPGRWVGIGSVNAASPALAAAERQHLEDVFSSVDRLEIYDEAWAGKIREQGSSEEKAWLDFVYDRSVLRGYTSERPIRMCYWRKPEGAPDGDLNPDRDGCGVLWYCPTLPATGRDAVALAGIVERRSLEHGFEPNLGFLSIAERTLDITGAVVFDRAVPGQDRLARDCHDAILADCFEAGYAPYRLGVGSMDFMTRQRPANRRLLRRLEETLDPHGILAPGRYAADPVVQEASKDLVLRLVRAVEAPETAERFHAGQSQKLRSLDIHGVDSQERWRLENP